MLRILALLATVATAATLSGGANAHPPDISVLYGGASHAPHGYSQPTYTPTYTQPTYGSTTYGNTYGTSAYVAPRYTGTRTYSAPGYAATPLYSKTYKTPTYRAPAYTSPVYDQPTYSPAPVSSYAGYTNPGYGYRHRRGPRYVQPRVLRQERPIPLTRHRSYGPYSRVPTSEGVNYGYSGGPTYGPDASPVINGVRVNRNPN